MQNRNDTLQLTFGLTRSATLLRLVTAGVVLALLGGGGLVGCADAMSDTAAEAKSDEDSESSSISTGKADSFEDSQELSIAGTEERPVLVVEGELAETVLTIFENSPEGLDNNEITCREESQGTTCQLPVGSIEENPTVYGWEKEGVLVSLHNRRDSLRTVSRLHGRLTRMGSYDAEREFWHYDRIACREGKRDSIAPGLQPYKCDILTREEADERGYSVEGSVADREFSTLTIDAEDQDPVHGNDEGGEIPYYAEYEYHGWLIIQGEPVQVFDFPRKPDSRTARGYSSVEFEMPQDKLEAASGFVMTLEQRSSEPASPSQRECLTEDLEEQSGGDYRVAFQSCSP